MPFYLQSAEVILSIIVAILTIFGIAAGWFKKIWRRTSSLFNPRAIVDKGVFKFKKGDYMLWDKRTEVACNEAVCLLVDLHPHKCFLFSRYDFTYMEEFAFNRQLPRDIRARILTLRDLLKEAMGRGELEETTPTGPNSWMAMPFTRKVGMDSLRIYAKKHDFSPRVLFPEICHTNTGESL